MMVEDNKKKLIFVFNADSGGKWAGLKDSLHKTFRKSTYECNLCQVTYGFFGIKKEWKNFVSDLDVPVEYMKKDKFTFEFLHKDEFHEKYDGLDHAEFPSAYIEEDSGIKIFISREEMNAVKDLDELKDLVDKKIEEYKL